MQELIDLLQKQNNLTAQQARGVLKTITNFVKDKFPMIGGAVDSMFGSEETSSENSTKTTAGAYIPDNAARADQLTKDKQSGFFEGNKEDYV
ncbi:hypothetical protein BH09BAC2_BH09BAC2_07950 [soil metagenome]